MAQYEFRRILIILRVQEEKRLEVMSKFTHKTPITGISDQIEHSSFLHLNRLKIFYQPHSSPNIRMIISTDPSKSGTAALRGPVLDNRCFTTFNTRKRKSSRTHWSKKIRSLKKIFFQSVAKLPPYTSSKENQSQINSSYEFWTYLCKHCTS